MAGDVIASHYAEPVTRSVASATTLRSSPSESGEAIRNLEAGETFLLLDDTLGWAWGYAASDRRVGYIPSSAVTAD